MQKPSVLTHVRFEITDKCNLYCKYCYRFDTEKIRESIDIRDRRMMKLAKKIVDAGVFNVTITGGEPFIRKDLLLKLVSFFNKKDVYVSINTNLLLADEKIISKLTQFKKCGFLVSCPSTDPKTYKNITNGGDYKKFENNLKLIHEYGFRCMISMVVTKENYTQIRQAAQDLKSLGVNRFSATPMSLNLDNPRTDLQLSLEEVRTVVKDIIWIEDNLDIVADTLEPLPICALPTEAFMKDYYFMRRKCNAGITSVAVSNTGEVRPCPHNPDSYGNVLDVPLKDICFRMKEWRERLYMPDECQSCKVAYKCGAGCRLNAKAYDNDWKGTGPWFVGAFKYDIFKDLQKHNMNQKIEVTNNTTLLFKKDCKWRKEEKNKYLVYTGDNMFYIDHRLLNLIIVLKEILPLKLDEIAQYIKVDVKNQTFINDIKFLCDKKILVPKK